MTRDQAKREIKGKLEEYLRETHRDQRKDGKFPCPFHNDTEESPNMSFDKKRNKVHCFRCGADEDIFSLIGKDRGLSDPKDIFNWAYQHYGITIHQPEKATEKPQERRDMDQNQPKTEQHTHNRKGKAGTLIIRPTLREYRRRSTRQTIPPPSGDCPKPSLISTDLAMILTIKRTTAIPSSGKNGKLLLSLQARKASRPETPARKLRTNNGYASEAQAYCLTPRPLRKTKAP